MSGDFLIATFAILYCANELRVMSQVRVQRRQEALQVELEQCGEDMDKMAALLDEMEELNKNATDLDMTLLDRNIDKMMPELGFTPEDSDQLVAAYRCARLFPSNMHAYLPAGCTSNQFDHADDGAATQRQFSACLWFAAMAVHQTKCFMLMYG